MRIIEIIALENGAHRNQSYNNFLPEGYAIVPDELDTPNFPFGDIEVEEIDGVMTVTKWEAREIPASDLAEEIIEPTQLDRVEAQITYTAMMTNTLLEV